MATLPLPTINVQRCTGCHACVDRCPTNALAMVGGKATLQAPDRCTSPYQLDPSIVSG